MIYFILLVAGLVAIGIWKTGLRIPNPLGWLPNLQALRSTTAATPTNVGVSTPAPILGRSWVQLGAVVLTIALAGHFFPDAFWALYARVPWWLWILILVLGLMILKHLNFRWWVYFLPFAALVLVLLVKDDVRNINTSAFTSQVESWLPWNWGSSQNSHNPCSGKVTYRLSKATGNIAQVFNPGGRCAYSIDPKEGVISTSDTRGDPVYFVTSSNLRVTKLAPGLRTTQAPGSGTPSVILLESDRAVVEVQLFSP